MKLNKLSKLAALLAAGALVFGITSCDSGNDEYVPEIPTTWIDLGETADSSVTAKWTFASDADGIGPDEVSWMGKILTPEGTGATLTGGDPCMIKYVKTEATVTGTGDNKLYVQAANKTASIEDPTGGASFILKTSNATNITVRAGGAGAAGATRIAVICYADGTPIIGKGSLGSSDVTTLHVKGAPAGTYKIYFNGSRIYEITTGDTVSQPLPYTSNEELTLSAGPANTLEALIDTHTFTLTGLGGKDETISAVWTSSNPKIATVKDGIVTAASANSEGTVKIRARIGMYYKEAEVTYKPCEKTIVSTIISSNLPKAETKILNWSSDDAKSILKTGVFGIPGVAEVVDQYAEITIGDVLKHFKNADVTKSYVYDEETKEYKSADSTEKAAGEVWAIKDPSANNGGLHCKDDTVNKVIDTGDYLKLDTILYSVSFKAKPSKPGVKISGISACLNSGKGAGCIGINLYKDGVKIGKQALSKKNTSADAITMFDTAENFDGEATFKFEFVIAKADKTTEGYTGQSVQIQNLGFVVSE